MIRLVIVMLLVSSAAFAQERRVEIKNKEGKVTGVIVSQGPKPTPTEGLAILCSKGRCEPPPPAAPAEPALRVLAVTRQPSPPKPEEPRFTNFAGPSPSTVSVPLPYPTVHVVLDRGATR
jgi:hypothetical protein